MVYLSKKEQQYVADCYGTSLSFESLSTNTVGKCIRSYLIEEWKPFELSSKGPFIDPRSPVQIRKNFYLKSISVSCDPISKRDKKHEYILFSLEWKSFGEVPIWMIIENEFEERFRNFDFEGTYRRSPADPTEFFNWKQRIKNKIIRCFFGKFVGTSICEYFDPLEAESFIEEFGKELLKKISHRSENSKSYKFLNRKSFVNNKKGFIKPVYNQNITMKKREVSDY